MMTFWKNVINNSALSLLEKAQNIHLFIYYAARSGVSCRWSF